jgi:hypothetical protein
VDFVGEYSMLRAWGVEGIGGHGARLARLLAKRYELVLELDRPKRARRGNGAKSDPLDATPRRSQSADAGQAGHTPLDRAAPGSVGAASGPPLRRASRHRRSTAAVQPGARRPEQLRERFRGRKLPAMPGLAAKLFISPKTVEATLARAYRKLGIRSRAELGARLARHTIGRGIPSHAPREAAHRRALISARSGAATTTAPATRLPIRTADIVRLQPNPQVTFRDEVGRLRAPIASGSVCAPALASPSRAARYRDKLAAEAPNVTDRGTTQVTVHRGAD